MEKLFARHDAYLADVPMTHIRDIMSRIDWNSRLIVIRGPKGVGKSTLMLQYIKKTFSPDDRHVLYCSADTNYFAANTLLDLADKFVKIGGKYLFIDEVHKYNGWSREIKEIYDLYKNLHIVLSGSSLIQINDGQADLSRRIIQYDMPPLSFREFLKLDKGLCIEPVGLNDLLNMPNSYCSYVKSKCRPLEHFKRFLQFGSYPFYFESREAYYTKLENVVNYTVDVELTHFRNLDIGNAIKVKALLRAISAMTPYEVDISKLSRTTGIARQTTLKYLKDMEEANMIKRLFTDIQSITDLQKPDKIYLDNTNLLYMLCPTTPQTGTVRETFFVQQVISANHIAEYAGYKSGDFRIDNQVVIEVGGEEKGTRQIKQESNAYIAADDIDSAIGRKIPLWAFGFLY